MSSRNQRFRHISLENCDSTNTYCLDIAKNGESGNLWVTAKTQSAGKGSRGRSWESLFGNLHASLLLHNPCKKEHLAGLTFVAALAARDTIYRVAQQSSAQGKVMLKWPNDVLFNGRKCGGILLESLVLSSSISVAVGFGINCTDHPSDTSYRATNLRAENIDCDAETVFVELAYSMERYLDIWSAGKGFSLIRKKWLDHAAGINEQITIRIPGKDTATGLFSGIDESGLLVLEDHKGIVQTISVADVFLLET